MLMPKGIIIQTCCVHLYYSHYPSLTEVGFTILGTRLAANKHNKWSYQCCTGLKQKIEIRFFIYPSFLFPSNLLLFIRTLSLLKVSEQIAALRGIIYNSVTYSSAQIN